MGWAATPAPRWRCRIARFRRKDTRWSTRRICRSRRLAKLNPQAGTDAAENWAASLHAGGTPGRVNFAAALVVGEIALPRTQQVSRIDRRGKLQRVGCDDQIVARCQNGGDGKLIIDGAFNPPIRQLDVVDRGGQTVAAHATRNSASQMQGVLQTCREGLERFGMAE